MRIVKDKNLLKEYAKYDQNKLGTSNIKIGDKYFTERQFNEKLNSILVEIQANIELQSWDGVYIYKNDLFDFIESLKIKNKG